MPETNVDTAIATLKSIVEKEPRRVVLVVGSGVTIGSVAGVPGTECASWAGLIQHGLEYASALDLADSRSLEGLFALASSGDAESMISAAESVSQMLGGRESGAYQAWLRSAFEAVEAEARSTPTLSAIKAASERGVRVATTNYDGVLERFLGLEAVVWSQRDRAHRVLQGEDDAVLHLHGHWQTSDSVIFGASDYAALGDAPGPAELLDAVRTLKTMVFIGMGAGMLDPTFGRLRRWAARTQQAVTSSHYWFVRSNEHAAISPETLSAERTVLVRYAEHQELAGLLRRMLPPLEQPKRPDAGVVSTVALILNVRVQEGRAHFEADEVSRALGVEVTDENTVELRRDAGPAELVDPRWWDRIAVDVREAVSQVHERARQCRGAVEFAVAGRAPLSVFAYAGHCAFQRLVGRIRYVNMSVDGATFDVVERGAADGAHTQFETDNPALDFVPPDGRRHAVYASAKLPGPVKVDAFLPLQGVRERGPQRPVSVVSNILPTSSGSIGMQDFTALRGEVEAALQRMRGSLGPRSRPVVAYSGPTWGAFELGFSFRPDVHGAVEFPHHVRDGETPGYLPAVTLSSIPAPVWFRCPRFLFMAAEPFADSRTRAGGTLSGVINALGERGVSGDALVRVDAMVTHDALHQHLNEFPAHVVMLHLHGGADGKVSLVGPTDKPREITADEVVAAFRRARVRPVLVVLSVCTSTLLGERLLDVADHVIVSVDTLDTRNAERFTERFFERALEGDSLADAFETARLAESANVPRARLRLLSGPEAVAADRVFFHRRQDV